MSNNMPSPADREVYADHGVSIHESTRQCSIGESDDGPIRIYVTAYRVPSLRVFQVHIRANATSKERASAVRWAARLPKGGWAEIDAEKWFKCKRAGAQAFWQSVGRTVADPLLELELEEFRDSDMDLEMETLSGSVTR